MYELQETFEAELAKLPERLLRELLASKLEGREFQGKAAFIDALAIHVLQGGGDEFQFESADEGDDIEIVFDERDHEFLRASVDEFTKELPGLVTALAHRLARADARARLKELPGRKLYEDRAFGEFCERLEERWGEAFDQLRLLLHLYTEVGAEYWKKRRRSRSRKDGALKEVLQRLHARSCQVFHEIVLLIENGFADGAMARWRTLYEICVTATVIADAPSDARLPQRYLDYEAVERKRRMDEYIRCHQALGEAPLSNRVIRQVERELAIVLSAYGRSFEQPFGWAIPFVHPTRASFDRLEAVAKKSEMRAYYKMASYSVHASPGGLFHRLSSLDDPELVLPGASNAGFATPAVNTAFSVTQLAGLLISAPYQLDDLVRLNTFVVIREKVVQKFTRAERMLSRDDRRIRSQATSPAGGSR